MLHKTYPVHYNKDLPCALCTARSRSSRCRNSVPVTGRETMLSVSPSSESVCCPWVWRCFLGVRGLGSFRSRPSEIFCRVYSYTYYRKGTSLYVNNSLSLTPLSASLSLLLSLHSLSLSLHSLSLSFSLSLSDLSLISL